MFFKHATVYALSDFEYSNSALDEKLAQHKFKPISDNQLSGSGFQHPVYSDSEQVILAVNDCLFSSVIFADRKVPADQVSALTEKRVNTLEEQGEKINNQRFAEIKEQAFLELIKFCPPKLKQVYFYIDLKANLLVIDDKSDGNCDRVTQLLRKSLGRFSCSIIDYIAKPCNYMTDWLSLPVVQQRLKMPDWLNIDFFSSIKCKGEKGSSIAIKSNAISTAALEGLETIECGFFKTREKEDKSETVLQFSVLSVPSGSSKNALKLTRLDFCTESAIESFDDLNGHTTDLFLMTSELRELFTDFFKLFEADIEQPEVNEEAVAELVSKALENVSAIEINGQKVVLNGENE